MNKHAYEHDGCNVGYAMSIIGGKWKIAIIWKLMDQRLRFNELRTELVGITEGVLLSQLKALRADGIVNRIDYDVLPLHVEYELTDQGRRLKGALLQIEQWGAQTRTQRDASGLGVAVGI